MDAPRYAPSPVSTTAPKHLPHLGPPLGPHEPASKLAWQSPPVSTQPSSYWTSSTTVHQPMARHLHGPLMSGLPENLASASPPCGFCKENEPRNRPMFMSHPLRDPLGRTVCPAASFHMSHLRRHWRPRSHKELLPGDQPGEKGQVCDLGPQKHNQDE